MGKEVSPEKTHEPELAERDDAELRCAQCEHPITRASLRTERHGKHEHAFMNPSGVPYRIALYSDAPGCAAYGEMESTFSWFPGHAWRIALCARCQTHVGWSFHGDASFFGLIVERIR